MNLHFPPRPVQDERTTAVGHASAFWAYIVLVFGLFIDVIVRGIYVPGFYWDLMALIMLSGLVGMAYQIRMRTFPWRWHLGMWLAIIPLQVILAYVVITFMLR